MKATAGAAEQVRRHASIEAVVLHPSPPVSSERGRLSFRENRCGQYHAAEKHMDFVSL